MKHFCHPDLIADHPLAIFFAVIAISIGQILDVKGGLVISAAILFLLNATVTFYWTYRRNSRLNGEVVEDTFRRLFAYIILGVGIIVWSNMGAGGKSIREIALQGIAGVELLVMAGMVARMTKRFRPIYRWFVTALDKALPFDFGSDEVNAILDKYDQNDG